MDQLAEIFFSSIHDKGLSRNFNVELLGIKENLNEFMLGLYHKYMVRTRKHSQIIYVTESYNSAKSVYEFMKSVLDDQIFLLAPTHQVLQKHDKVPITDLGRYYSALEAVNPKKNCIIIVPLTVFIQDHRYALKQVFCTKNMAISPEKFTQDLETIGYIRSAGDDESSSYRYREFGGVVEVFSPYFENPRRIEFFDEDIDLITEYDSNSGMSIREHEGALFYGNSGSDGDIVDCFIDKGFNDLHFWFDNPRILADSSDMLQEKYHGELSVILYKFNELIDKVWEYGFKTVMTALFSAGLIYSNSRITSFKFDVSLIKFPLKTVMMLEFFKKGLRENIEKKYINIFLIKSLRTREVLLRYLKEIEVECVDLEQYPQLLSGTPVITDRYAIEDSCFFSQYGINLYSENDIKAIFNLSEKVQEDKIDDSFDPMQYFSSFQSGDFIVHKRHGIGIFNGIQKLFIAGVEKEFFAISYSGDDKLYVPPEKAFLIQKYIGKEGYSPTISRLHSKKWDSTKEKIRQSVTVIAQELVRLYAERKKAAGFEFASVGTWMEELEDSFEFNETTEQRKAIEAVLEDMERPSPMDRLICGDVGFGKTEVAIRASMKAVINEKQVAVLVPTTILAKQHFLTFSERFRGFPVRIDYLNRFKTRSQQQVILKKLSSGGLDIVIGTHRLLSKDIEFADLGLLIIDEEHRFGVKHKEKLRKMRANVDTLSMTATPIPRTMNMALSGIRDLSIIMKPPDGRNPIITEVLQYDEKLIKAAVSHEIQRGGQVFFMNNRIEGLEFYASVIRDLVPEARICVAHGQLEEKNLEKVYMDFMDRKYDVLVSTSIIESGIDIPTCNTIIINNCQQLGLSQMYQIRGRVGRSKVQAYSYFLYPPGGLNNPVVKKRLEAISEFTELGAGFKVAIKDMELRGAGTVLGYEQSGHILSVGFEMYCEILKEAVEELREDSHLMRKNIDTEIEINVSALIPDTYIYDFNDKIQWYKRISSIRKVSLLWELFTDMIQEAGPAPEQVKNLFLIMEVKILAAKIGITKVSLKGDRLEFSVSEDFEISDDEFEKVRRYTGIHKITPESMSVHIGKRRIHKIFDVIREFFTIFESRF